MVAFLIQACVAGMAFGFMAAFNTWTRQMCVKYYATLSQGYNCKISLLHWITVGKVIVHLKKKSKEIQQETEVLALFSKNTAVFKVSQQWTEKRNMY